jgi:nicotinamidase-related amidase
VLGTIVDAYFRGYDVAVIQDCVATSSPQGGLENVLHNAGNVSHPFVTQESKAEVVWQSYGFLTNSEHIVASHRAS